MLVAIAIGLAISIAAFVLVRRWEGERVERAFEAQARHLGQNLAATLAEYEESLYTLRSVFTASEDVTFAEFRTAAAELRERHPGIQMLEWLPRIPDDQRTATESRARSEVRKDFEIKEGGLPLGGETANPDLLTAGKRAEYLPVLFIEPLHGFESLFGFDHFTGPHQRAIARARDTGGIAATRRISWRGDAPGWYLFLPIYAPGSKPKTPEDRLGLFRGCLKGSFRLSDLITTSIGSAERRDVELLLADHTPASTEPFLISFSGDTVRNAPPPTEAEFRAGRHVARKLPVGGRDWVVLFRPAAGWLAAQDTGYSYGFLVGGLALTGLAAMVMRGAQRRTAQVREMVAQRTAELDATQNALRGDIRQRATAERALRASDQRYRAFITNSGEAIWRFEIDPPARIDQPEDALIDELFRSARVAECNDAAARMYGYQRGEEMVGKPIEEILPRSVPANIEHLRTYVRSGFRLENSETHELDRHGRTRIFLNNMVGIVEEGQLLRTWGTQRDVTEQHQRIEEKARLERKLQETQKLESLGILAGGIAHDFNNLLTGILGNASLARMDLPADSPVHANLAAIETVTQRAADLCKQMLAYSGKGRFVVDRLDLSALLRDTAELIQVSISKNVVLKFFLSETLPAISADATQLRQIIMNLVINASDAIGDQRGQITLRTGIQNADRAYLADTYLSPDLPPGDYVFLEVSDDGCGMDAATQARIFDPFYTTKFTGRGLGLAAVLGIVRGHRGALRVYSEPGKGSTFKLLLPAVAGPSDTVALPGAFAAPWRACGTVLVIDDEAAIRNVGARMLQAWGFETETACNGREGLEKFRLNPARFAAVLLDLTMPEMDGTVTFTELRRIRPEVRVLLMSGFNEQDAISGFAGKGLSGFLQKPFTPEALQAKLRAILEGPPPE